MGRTLLSAGLLDLCGLSISDQPVTGLEFLHRLSTIVDEGKSSCLSTTKLCSKAEDGDLVLVCFVKLAEFLSELILGDIGAVWVEDITANKPVSHLESS